MYVVRVEIAHRAFDYDYIHCVHLGRGVVMAQGAAMLKTFRKTRELTQPQAAELAGISVATWSNYESGRRKPQSVKLRGLAKLLEDDGLLEASWGKPKTRTRTRTRVVKIQPWQVLGPLANDPGTLMLRDPDGNLREATLR